MPDENILFDADGNSVELPDSIENLKTMAETAKEYESTKAESDKKILELEEKLEKESGKVGNWRELRDIANQKDNKLTETEKALISAQEEVEKNSLSAKDLVVNSWTKEALDAFVIEDEELKEKVLKQFDEIKGDIKSREEIIDKMKKAYVLEVGEQPQANPIKVAAGAMSAGLPAGNTKKDKMPEDVKALGKLMDPTLKDEDFESKE